MRAKAHKSSAFKPYFWTLVLLAIVWETFSLLPPRAVPQGEKDPFHANYLRGVIHVHSLYSDGSGSVEEIAQAANAAGLDFLILTDHNTGRARVMGKEHAYGPLDLYVEMEASTPAGHCLAFYSNTAWRNLPDLDVNHLVWAHFLGKDNTPGVFLCIAHPSNIKNPWNRLDRFGDGMEVVNFDSVWQRELEDAPLGFFATALLYPFNNYLAALRFFQLYPKDITVWDAMTISQRHHFGILAHDTHEKTKLNNSLSFRWPTYAQTFRLASNIVFLKEPRAATFEARKEQLYHSLREGRVAMAFDGIYPFPGNDWRVECPNEPPARSGDVVANSHAGCRFVIDTPKNLPFPRVVRLMRNGDVQHEVTTPSQEVQFPLDAPGVYRVEVWVEAHTAMHLLLDRRVPYVLYNPIYVN